MKTTIILTAAALAAGLAGAAAQTNTLNGAIFEAPDGTTINSVASALSFVTGTPSATFLSTLVNNTGNGGNGYNASDGSTVNTYLGKIGDTALTGGSTILGSEVTDLTGTLTVATAGTYTFSNNNDDGGAFFLGGNGTPGSGLELAQNDGLHGAQPATSTDVLAPGSYAIEYIAYNTGCCGYTGRPGNAGNNSGGGIQHVADITGPNGAIDVVTSAVPEPTTWVAAGGLLLLAAGDFRRRLRA